MSSFLGRQFYRSIQYYDDVKQETHHTPNVDDLCTSTTNLSSDGLAKEI